MPTIPAAMVGLAEGNAMKPAGTVTVDGTAQAEIVTANADIIAGFSSRGPAPFTRAIKPDITAPGVNVASSVFDGEFAFFQGTSMLPSAVSVTASLVGDAVEVNLTADRRAPNGDYSGDVVLTAADGQEYRLPFWLRITNR